MLNINVGFGRRIDVKRGTPFDVVGRNAWHLELLVPEVELHIRRVEIRRHQDADRDALAGQRLKARIGISLLKIIEPIGADRRLTIKGSAGHRFD